MSGERERTVEEIRALAAELLGRDRAIAELMSRLADALERNLPEDVRAYASAIPPRAVAEDLVRRHLTVWGLLELVRGGLVLLPIAVTWYGLSAAATAYGELLTRRPDLVSQPFLLLWQGGFEGAGGLSFSALAATDGALISLLIALSLAIHYKADVRDPHTEARVLLRESQIRGLFARALALSPSSTPLGVATPEDHPLGPAMTELALAVSRTAVEIQGALAAQTVRSDERDGALLEAIERLGRSFAVASRGPSALVEQVAQATGERERSILEQTSEMLERLEEVRKSQQVAMGSVTLQTDAMNYMAKALVLASERVQVAAQALGDSSVPGNVFRRRPAWRRWLPALVAAGFALALGGGVLLSSRAEAQTRATFYALAQTESAKLRSLEALALSISAARSSANDAALVRTASQVVNESFEIDRWLATQVLENRGQSSQPSQSIFGAMRAVTAAATRGARGVALWLQASPAATEAPPSDVVGDVLFASGLLRDLQVQIAVQASR